MTLTTKSSFRDGWDEKRVAALIDHYEMQSEDEAVAEDEALRGISRRNLDRADRSDDQYEQERGQVQRPDARPKKTEALDQDVNNV